MNTARCTRCGAIATDETLQKAVDKLNHAIAMTKGMKCGPDYNRVVEVKSETDHSVIKPKKIIIKPKKIEPKIVNEILKKKDNTFIEKD